MFSLIYSQTQLKCIRLAGLFIVDPHTDALNAAFVKNSSWEQLGSCSIPNPLLCLHVIFRLPKVKQMNKAQQKLCAEKREVWVVLHLCSYLQYQSLDIHFLLTVLDFWTWWGGEKCVCAHKDKRKKFPATFFCSETVWINVLINVILTQTREKTAAKCTFQAWTEGLHP